MCGYGWILAAQEAAMSVFTFGSQIKEVVNWTSSQELNRWGWILQSRLFLIVLSFRPLFLHAKTKKENQIHCAEDLKPIFPPEEI